MFSYLYIYLLRKIHLLLIYHNFYKFSRAMTKSHDKIKNPKTLTFSMAFGFPILSKKGEFIPTRRVKSTSKLFCIEDLIRRGFI